jgi:two-component system sensor histidine kinase PilS (NtrC family)
MPFTTPGRRLLHLGIGSYVLRNAQGEADGEVVIFQDVTDVVAMEEDLRRSERLAAVGELSASIAHEIRNPLAAISGSIEMMQARVATGEGDPARLMGIVVREVDRLDRLIADFLQFARPGAPQLEDVDVAEVIGEVLEMFDATGATAISTESAVTAGLCVEADPGQLRQVLWNLLQNAIQAMPEGGVVRFEASLSQGGDAEDRSDEEKPFASEEPARVEIAVMDQGSGIAADAVEHVFDPFFTTKVGGTGLGLAIVHRVIAEHHGVVRIERGDERFVTVVRVALPGRIAS